MFEFQNDVFNMKDWQDGLRALLPNINISFGTQQLNNVESRLNTQHNSTQKSKSFFSPHFLKSIRKNRP